MHRLGCRAGLEVLGHWAELEAVGCQHLKHFSKLGVHGMGNGVHGKVLV